MNELAILETIKKINPWFKTKAVPSRQLLSFKRREFSRLAKRLNDLKLAELIIGGRRVGKSVLIYQLIDYLLKQNIDPKRILFIQGDNTILRELSPDGKFLSKVFNIYQKHILEEDFEELKKTIYVFIDEAHQISDWDLEVKTLLDLKYSIKFIITGSSSFELRKGSQAPLTGRTRIEILPPFSFADFSRYNITEERKQDFDKQLTELSNKFKNSLIQGDIQEAKNTASTASHLIENFNIKHKFNQYLFTGSFPYIIANPDDDSSRYLKDLLTTTLAKDILSRTEIRDSQAFERLMVNLCINTGKRIHYKNFATKLGIDERSVSKYIDYYIDSHWISVSSPYVFHKKTESVKTEKKIYIIDSGVINALSFKDERDLEKDRNYRGNIIENIVHNHLLSFKQSQSGVFQNYLPFWIDPNGKEIDFIFEISGGVIPIETKAKGTLSEEDIEPVLKFTKDKDSAKFGIITTDDLLEIKDGILFIPHITLILLL